MTRRKRGAVPGRPHHISSIAHLFLEDQTPAASDGSAVARELAIAAPGTSPVSAFAAAGLARAAGRPAVLVEGADRRWSARSFLEAGDGPSGQGLTAQSPGRRVWDFPRENEGVASRDPVRWNHLGCLTGNDLARLEAVAAWREVGPEAPVTTAGLVWCLLAEEATRLGPTYLLGRLVDVIHPRRLEILVFPDGWSMAGRAGWRKEVLSGPDGSGAHPRQERCAELASRACRGLPVRIRQVPGRENHTSRFAEGEFWGQLAREMTGGPDG